MTLIFDGWPQKTIGHLFYATLSFLHHFVAIGEFNWSDSPETPNWVKIDDFLSRVTLKFDGWPSKTIGHLFYAASSFVHHFVAIGEFKLELQSGNAQFGSKSMIFFSRVTLKFDRWPSKSIGHLFYLLCYFKLCASFHSHWWIQTGVTVRKGLIWVKINDFFSLVTLKFDGWPPITIGHLFYATSSFVQHFVAIDEFKLEL